MLKNKHNHHLANKKNYSNNSSTDNEQNVFFEKYLTGPKDLKRSLRKLYLQKRLLLKETDLLNKSKDIADKLIDHPIYKSSQNIALYSPIDSEVDTSFIFKHSRLLGKNTYFPKVYKDNLRFYEISNITDLKASRFGIKEPISSIKKRNYFRKY